MDSAKSYWPAKVRAVDTILFPFLYKFFSTWLQPSTFNKIILRGKSKFEVIILQVNQATADCI